MKWGQGAFKNFRVVPPGTGICHQVNLEYLAQTIWVDVDGNGWTAPLPALGRHAPPATTRPDVRRQFEALPEFTP